MFKTFIAAGILAVGLATAAIAAPAISAADNAFGTDMNVVHEMLAAHDKINRTVTNLPDGIRTVTESDDPQVAKEIKDHVASMAGRLKDGRVFNVASHTLPTIFAKSDTIRTHIEQTPTGVIVTQTSTDPTTVVALQKHAGEVSDLARGGMGALMRQVMANGGPMAQNGANGGPPMMAQMMERMMQSGGPMGGMTGGVPMSHGQAPFQGGPSTQTTP